MRNKKDIGFCRGVPLVGTIYGLTKTRADTGSAPTFLVIKYIFPQPFLRFVLLVASAFRGSSGQ